MSGPGPAGERRLSGRQLGRLVRPGAAPEPPGPYYAALADTVRGLILDGRLPVRTRLPAERDLARALDVSRTTVTAAYNRLRETGFVESRHGSGSWTALPVPGGGSGGPGGAYGSRLRDHAGLSPPSASGPPTRLPPSRGRPESTASSSLHGTSGLFQPTRRFEHVFAC